MGAGRNNIEGTFYILLLIIKQYAQKKIKSALGVVTTFKIKSHYIFRCDALAHDKEITNQQKYIYCNDLSVFNETYYNKGLPMGTKNNNNLFYTCAPYRIHRETGKTQAQRCGGLTYNRPYQTYI